MWFCVCNHKKSSDRGTGSWPGNPSPACNRQQSRTNSFSCLLCCGGISHCFMSLGEKTCGHVAQIHPNPAFRVSHQRNLHAHMAHGSGPWGVAFGRVFLLFQLLLCWLLTLPGVRGSPSLQPQALGRPVPEPWRGQPTPPAAQPGGEGENLMCQIYYLL